MDDDEGTCLPQTVKKKIMVESLDMALHSDLKKRILDQPYLDQRTLRATTEFFTQTFAMGIRRMLTFNVYLVGLVLSFLDLNPECRWLKSQWWNILSPFSFLFFLTFCFLSFSVFCFFFSLTFIICNICAIIFCTKQNIPIHRSYAGAFRVIARRWE